MKLNVNGAERDIESVHTAADLLEKLEIRRERVAVMLNNEVLRRANLEATSLKDGDVVEVITMVGGG